MLVLTLLFLFIRLEAWIDRNNQYRRYKIVTGYQHNVLDQYEQLFTDCQLKYKRIRRTRSDEKVTGIWNVSGSEKAHDLFVEKMFNDPLVRKFEF